MFMKLGNFVISERRSIKVKDLQINVNLHNDNAKDQANCSSGSGTCASPIKNREIVFTLEFVGKVSSNQTLFNAFQSDLNDICVNASVQWQRRVCDEDIESYTITGAYMKRLEMDREMYGVRTAEVHLTTQDEQQVDVIQITLEPLAP